MWWAGWCPTRLHRWIVLIPPLSFAFSESQACGCKTGLSDSWKKKAQHLSKLGVRHVMWGLDGFDPGLSLATLHSPRHCFGVFVLVFLLLGVCYWLCYVQQLSTFMPKYLHGLQCSVVLPIYGGIMRYNVVYLFFLSFIHFQRGQGYQLRRRMNQAQSVSGAAQTHERRVGDLLHPAVAAPSCSWKPEAKTGSYDKELDWSQHGAVAAWAAKNSSKLSAVSLMLRLLKFAIWCNRTCNQT